MDGSSNTPALAAPGKEDGADGIRDGLALCHGSELKVKTSDLD